MCSPCDGVQHERAEVSVTPIPVHMTAGEAEAASGIRASDSPGHSLFFFAFEDGGADSGVIAVGSVTASEAAVFANEGIGGWKVSEHGDKAGVCFSESHVVVPFIVYAEGPHTAGDGMFGEVAEVSGPVGVYGPVCFEVAADPFEEGVSGGSFGDFDTVVDADHADAAFLDGLEPVEVLIKGMSATAIGVDDDGVGVIENGFVSGPAIGVNGGFDADIGGIESICEEHAACAVFVSSVAMAGTPRDEGDFFGCREFFEADVAELHSHGWTDVSLEGEESGGAAFLKIVIGDIDGFQAIDEVLEVVAVGDNAVFVPVFLFDGFLDFGGVADGAGDFDFEFAVVANEFCGLSALSEDTAEGFAVEDSGVGGACFEVGLVAADAPFPGEFEATVLDTGVSADHAVFEFEFEVIDFATAPDDEGIGIEFDLIGGPAGDCALLDAPDTWIAVPAVEGFAVEEFLPVIGGD